MEKIVSFSFVLVLSGCASLPTTSSVQHAFNKEHPSYKVQDVSLSEQEEQDRRLAQFSIRYSKPTDTPGPVQFPGMSVHLDVWYYHQHIGRWVAGKREVGD